MPYQIVVTQEAIADLYSILDYLDRHWSVEVGDRFLEAYKSRLELLRHTPWMYAASERQPGLRRCFISKQNVLFYQVIETRQMVEIIAIKDTRSNPDMEV